MTQNNQPFNPDEFAKWLVEGVKDTLHYRFRQIFNRDQLLELIRAQIPTRGQLFHKALKQAFIQNGFEFELLKQGDALFHLIRKKTKKEGPIKKRLLLIPGFGDTPASWMTPYAFCKKEFEREFDEIMILDFPGYLGFLSHTQMVPSLEVLLNVVQMVCDTNPPTVMIGHSLGGWLAGKVGQNLKKPVEHLILVAPSGLTPLSERGIFADFILNMKSIPFEELIKKMVHEPKLYYQFLKQELAYFYSKKEIEEFVNSVHEDQFIHESKPFACHQLTVIWGDEDGFVPSHWMRYWVECFGPYLDSYFIHKTGHLPQTESPKATADLLKKVIFNKLTDDSSETRWKKITQHTKKFTYTPKPEVSPAQKLIS